MSMSVCQSDVLNVSNIPVQKYRKEKVFLSFKTTKLLSIQPIWLVKNSYSKSKTYSLSQHPETQNSCFLNRKSWTHITLTWVIVRGVHMSDIEGVKSQRYVGSIMNVRGKWVLSYPCHCYEGLCQDSNKQRNLTPCVILMLNRKFEPMSEL